MTIPQAEPQTAPQSVSPTIMVVEDTKLIRVRVCSVLERAGYEVIPVTSFGEGRAVIDNVPLDFVLLDVSLAGDTEDGDPGQRGGVRLMSYLAEHVPNTPVVVVTSDESAATAISFLQRGALHYLNKPVPDEVTLHWAAIGTELARSRRIATRGVGVEAVGHDGPEWHVGSTPAMLSAEEMVNLVAPTKAAVLINGQTGSGKEVVARAVHRRSTRSNGPFVWINCGAVPQELIESELFGHEKGAFTGAAERKLGLFEVADGGTLFLDELSSLPIDAQPKLLRALEDFRIRRVGGTSDVSVDVRVISATNYDLEDMIEDGTFREDLLYRLSVMPIDLPPLCERVQDIPFFSLLFLTADREGVTAPEGLTERAITALCDFDWPGNVRQLSNTMERAAIMAAGAPLVDVNHLPPEIATRSGSPRRRNGVSSGGTSNGSINGAANGAANEASWDLLAVPPADLPYEGLDMLATRDAWEQRMMLQALARTDDNQKRAADLLRLTRDRWRSRMSKFGISL